jgi:hypothetical protein
MVRMTRAKQNYFKINTYDTMRCVSIEAFKIEAIRRFQYGVEAGSLDYLRLSDF